MLARRKVLATLLLVMVMVAALAALAGAPRGAAAAGNGPPVTVMTRNIYFGADLSPALGATTPAEFEAAVAQIAAQAFASDFPKRAAALAEEIIAHQPHLVGLQEASIWTFPSPFGPVTFDFAQLILAELAARGYPYQAIAVAPGFSVAFGPIALTFTDVILARADLPADQFSLANVQTGSYAAFLPVPTPVGTLAIPRQWASVDASLFGKSFRFVTTYLESAVPIIRILQAQELLAITADSPLPVILVGDLNSELDTAGDAAWLAANAGFADAWSNSQNIGPGYTCCQHPTLRVAESLLDKRIDFVMTRGDFSIINAHLVGDTLIADPADPSLPVLWASDHAGVVAKLFLPNN
jgi:hypothetical protein